MALLVFQVPMYMRNSVAAIIMYDITNRQSFEDVDKWSEGFFFDARIEVLTSIPEI